MLIATVFSRNYSVSQSKMSETLEAIPAPSEERHSASVECLEGCISEASFHSSGRRKGKTVRKLDVLRAKHINALTYFNIIVVGVLFLYTIYGVIEARTYAKQTILVEIAIIGDYTITPYWRR